MTKEKSFQNYYLKIASPAYRIDPVANPGYPDTEVVRGMKTYRVELKILEVGPSGDKKLKSLFKPTQPPWYYNFLAAGGKGLYVCFKLNKGYGLLEVDKTFCINWTHTYYQDLLKSPLYKEYDKLTELIKQFI